MTFSVNFGSGGVGASKVKKLLFQGVDTTTWTVPVGVTRIHAEAWGKGGNASTAVLAAANAAAYISANIEVVGGQIINISIARNGNGLFVTTVSGSPGWFISAGNGVDDTLGNGSQASGGAAYSVGSPIKLNDIIAFLSEYGQVNAFMAISASPIFGGKASVAFPPSSAGEIIVPGSFPGGGAAYARNGAGSSIAYGGDGAVRISYILP